MSNRTGGLTLVEIDQGFRSREIVTVRCVCGWERTGLAEKMLYWQKRHTRRHLERRASAARHYAHHTQDVLARKRERYYSDPERYRAESRQWYARTKAA